MGFGIAGRTIGAALRAAALPLAAGVLALPAAARAETRYPDYRYRLTVAIDTPEGVKRGSSVIAVQTAIVGPDAALDGKSLRVRVIGEAVAVDLGRRGTLFALLGSPNRPVWAAGAFLRAIPPIAPATLAEAEARGQGTAKLVLDDAMRKILAFRGVYTIPRHYIDKAVPGGRPTTVREGYPMLARFRNPAEPATVEQVDPDDLTRAFGSGVAIRSLTIERTADPVSWQLRKRLPWLDASPATPLAAPRSADDYTFPARLHQGEFIKR